MPDAHGHTRVFACFVRFRDATGRVPNKQLDLGTPPPLVPPLPPSPSLLPKVAQLPVSPSTAGVREDNCGRERDLAGRWHRSFLQSRSHPGRRSCHAGALGARCSMKGGDQAYTRGPSLGWFFAKCCCCFPCRGEWHLNQAGGTEDQTQ